jgi:hypothetical protein
MTAQSERWFQAIVNVAVISGGRRRRRRQSVHDGEQNSWLERPHFSSATAACHFGFLAPAAANTGVSGCRNVFAIYC